MQGLDQTVMTYLEVAGRLFQQAQKPAEPQSSIRVVWSPTRLFQEAVLAAEESEAFSALLAAAKEAYSPTHPQMEYSPWTRSAVSSFFRRSGVYSSHFSGERIDPRAMTDQFQFAFGSTTHHVKYVAPLEFVSFGFETVDCGSYQIRRYSRQELDELLGNDTRSVFYQNLQIDTAVLQGYWFIVVEGTEPHPLCADLPTGGESSRPVQFSPYPHSPIVPPEDPPDMRGLEMMPRDIGEGPLFYINLNEHRTLDFSRWMQHIDRLFDVVATRHDQWPFIDLATGFQLKAFGSRGMESLLWNVASIEALLGERRNGGLTKLMAARVARALGKDNERRKIRKLFEGIYDFRSAIVHGDARLRAKSILESEVVQARDLACLLLLWMLSWLADVAERWEQSPVPFPTREQLLAVLDLAEGDLDTVAKLLGAVPPKFPCVPAWLDPEQLGERWRAEDKTRMPTPEQSRAAQEAFGTVQIADKG
ncbi:MAG: HEPN domain-containing protein [Candidatus Solibacter sp.]|nr:HEPN domain-containing protein [Candidatus Solibacter sp.]